MTVGMSMFTTVVITLFVTLLVLYIADTASQSESPYCFSKTARLSWKMMKKLYGINPSRWRYERVITKNWDFLEGWNKVILYNTNDDELCMWNKYVGYSSHGGYQCPESIVRVKLSFFSWIMFHLNRLFNKRKDTTGTEMLLDSVSKDIDKVRQKAQEQIAEASKTMQDITQRLTL